VSSGAFGAAWGGSHAASGSSGATPADESAGGSGLIWLSGPPDAPDTAGERQPGLRTQPMPPATRASMAMSGSLLISAAILVGVLVPAIASGDRQETPPQAHPGSSAPAPAGVAPEAERSGGSVAESVPATSAPPKVGRVTGLRKAGDGGRVPAITGLDRAAAVQRIEKAGFVVGAVTEVDSTEAVGKVLRVWPAPGSMAELGSRIDLEVSAGVKVPALAGLTRRQAESALAAAGLAPGDVTSRCLAMPDGQVLSSRPAAGRRVAPGTGVALVVARHGAVVPAVVGRSQAEARQALRAAGFTVRAQARIVPPGEQAGVALAQAVAAGTCAAPGRTVTIVVGVEGTAGPGPGDPGPDPSDPTPGATADPGGITGVGDDATT
jgi:beta-lactam-binding protein with PASTA domain